MRFRDFILKQPCLTCNTWPVDPDHNPTRGARGNADHDLIAPLCRQCHTERHAIGLKRFETKHDINLDAKIDALIIEYVERVRQWRWT